MRDLLTRSTKQLPEMARQAPAFQLDLEEEQSDATGLFSHQQLAEITPIKATESL
jgi:hypothetical protein